MLDDEDTRANIAGVFWDDNDLNRQLDASQLILLNVFAGNGNYYLMQGLLTRFTSTLTADVQIVALPANYFLAVGADVENRPARLHAGGVGVTYEQFDHYGVMVEGSNVVFKGGNGQTGSLWYIKYPKSFAIQPVTDRAEFDDMVYQCILFHAASTLMIKDDGTTSRYQKLYKDTMTKILQEPQAMHPMFDDAAIP